MSSRSAPFRTSPWSGRTARAAVVLLVGASIVLLVVGGSILVHWRTAVFALPVLALAAGTATVGRRVWRDPDRRGPVAGLLALALTQAGAVVWWIRARRPLDVDLWLSLLLLAGLLVAVWLLGVTRLHQIGWRPPWPARAHRVALTLAGVGFVGLGTVAPVVDQPPLSPLQLSAKAAVDPDCGRVHVPDPRGMGGRGYVSINPAPEPWWRGDGRRTPGTLVLGTDDAVTFHARGLALELTASNGLPPCLQPSRR